MDGAINKGKFVQMINKSWSAERDRHCNPNLIIVPFKKIIRHNPSGQSEYMRLAHANLLRCLVLWIINSKFTNLEVIVWGVRRQSI